MKIQISYIPEEKEKAAAIVAALRKILPGAVPRYREKYPPRRHIYISTPEPKEKP